MPPSPQPWDQQPGEPDRFYTAFQTYLQLGPHRSVLKAAAALRTADPTAYSDSYFKHISLAWHWRTRAAAWDAAYPPQPTPPDRLPWEQQPGEPDRWYRVFRRYLDLGPARNVHHAAVLCFQEDPLAPDPCRAYDEARRRRWHQRAEAWDLHCLAEDDADAAPGAQPDTDPHPEPPNPWDRAPQEPLRAYGLFCHYLELGPSRSISHAARDLSNIKETTSPSLFYALAKRWKWQQRAAAWDAYQRDLFTAHVQERRLALQERRLDVAELYYDQTVDALDTANITNLSEAEARRMLPTLHSMLKDLGAIQRTEIEYGDKLRGHTAQQEAECAEVMDER